MNTIQDIFKQLQQKERTSNGSFIVSKLPFSEYHKIGVSHDNEPIFFIVCNEKGQFTDISLELISVMFDRECKIYEDNNISESTYTIIKLNSDSYDLQHYFIDVVCLVLQKLPSIPSRKSLYVEINKIIGLFQSLSTIPKKTIQGLWAELLVIEQSSNPEILIKAWHSSPDDKFDFNDGKDKIEVKSTTKNQRIHSFSINQLNPNQGSLLVIASTFVIQTGIGKSVTGLRDLIMERVIDFGVQLKLNEQIIKVLGTDFEKSTDIYFDYQAAIDSLEYYNCKDIPTIDIRCIPSNISDVRFDADLTYITPCNLTDELLINSQLFNSIKK